mmetsp:Transcript_39412/g.45854  ORF Transcript_39412/g.45854 Transcript_39412/m.45854 type:complete len:112 (+) Transcript_39412:40-375(+)|eukprot:CAMPEP_0176415726 /NCGR_PEP_ID=MMETSP0127-20121128/5963_1 /TAXON_ID=938130 /ORGANISM="Platyophrya macrostoma, Strain WH" /LENGTH=111 /DNA_ID=CAMNT_0017795747 /DNA_START=41 /DNA_END=376 /DNA_ORIENTATION=+
MSIAPLVTALEKIASLHFPQITFFNAREVVKEMLATSSEQSIDRSVQQLSSPMRDVLMKVVYVALSSDPKNSTTFFKWHAAIYKAAGPGSILRVVTDKPPMPGLDDVAPAA